MRRVGTPRGLSVIMPVHGDAPYFDEAFQSISFEGIEEEYELLLILDNTSRDMTSILNSNAKNVRLVESRFSGVANAHNEGINSAKFDVVAIAHSDDVYSQTRLSRQLSFLRDHSNVICVGTQIDLIDSKGMKIGHGIYPIQPKTLARAMRYKSAIAHPTAMYRKSIAVSVGGYRQDFAPAEDYDLWRRMLQMGHFANLATTEISYRLHPGQTSGVQGYRSSQKKAQVIVSGLTEKSKQLPLSGTVNRLRANRIASHDFQMMNFFFLMRDKQKARAYLRFCRLLATFPIRTTVQALLYIKTKSEIHATRESAHASD